MTGRSVSLAALAGLSACSSLPTADGGQMSGPDMTGDLSPRDANASLDAPFADGSPSDGCLGDGGCKPFTLAPVLALNGGVRCLQVADLDGDGKADIAFAPVSGTKSPHVSALFGSGPRKFEPAVTLADGVCGDSTSLTVGDFNGDSRVDLAYRDSSEGELWTLQNQGGRTFGLPVKIPGLTEVSRNMVSADMDRDGKSDIVAGTVDGRLWVLISNGKNGFAMSTSYDGNGSGGGLAAGDIDLDGWPDVLSDGEDPRPMSQLQRPLLFFNDKGVLASPIKPGISLGSPVIADMDRDGLPDIVVSVLAVASDAPFVGVYKNYGARKLGPIQLFPSGTPAYRACIDLAVGDLNNDGYPDVVCGDQFSGIYILLNRGDGTLTRSTVFSKILYAPIVLVDLDGDKKDDLILGAGDKILVYFNDTP